MTLKPGKLSEKGQALLDDSANLRLSGKEKDHALRRRPLEYSPNAR